MPVDSDLERHGWRQGSVVKHNDIPSLLEESNRSTSDEAELIVISQSCDLAQDATTEPSVEVILAEPIAKKEGEYTFNKNPRILHTSLLVQTQASDVAHELHVQLRSVDKLHIDKHHFLGLSPDTRKVFSRTDLEALVNWLAARYSRPALPTTFNDALAKSDPHAKKRRKLAKAISPFTLGIYVEIHPDRELAVGHNYRVNLLGLIQQTDEGHRTKVERGIGALADLMRTAGMEVSTAVESEHEVSIATLKRFKRFYFDDISYKQNDILPVKL